MCVIGVNVSPGHLQSFLEMDANPECFCGLWFDICVNHPACTETSGSSNLNYFRNTIIWIIIEFELFQEHHEEDFFLYIAYSDESVYGNE